MEDRNRSSINQPQNLSSNLQRTKMLATILIPLSLIVILITGAGIFGQLTAAPKAIADEVPLGARILVDLLGFVGAVAGLIAALIALTSSMSAAKLQAAGDHEAAAAAAEKSEKYGKNLPLLIGIFIVLTAVKVVQAFFLNQ